MASKMKVAWVPGLIQHFRIHKRLWPNTTLVPITEAQFQEMIGCKDLSCMNGSEPLYRQFLHTLLFKFIIQKLKPWVKADLEAFVKTSALPSPFVSLHARQSDKYKVRKSISKFPPFFSKKKKKKKIKTRK
jgi:hypothetical protein